MSLSRKLLWNIYAAGVGAVTTIVAAKAVNAAWELATGDSAPQPNDPDVPLRRALTWAIASGLGVGLAQLVMSRLAAAQWAKVMGEPAPGFGKVNDS